MVADKIKFIGDQYQRETKYCREDMASRVIDWEHLPKKFKEYPAALKIIKLLPAIHDEGLSLWRTLVKRRSQRDFTKSAISLGELSQLLFATQGITEKSEGYLLRTSPSAGALYPIETYLAVNRVQSLQTGLYH